MKPHERTAVVLVLLLCLALFSSVGDTHAQEKTSLRVVFVSLSWNNQLPFRIAIAKGFFKDQGLSAQQELRTEGRLKP